MSQNISMMKDPDFQKCGEIMVAPKRNTFAMSCLHCEAIFTRLPAFMRHLHHRHIEVLQFEAKDAEVEVYAVEELVSQTLCVGEDDSEESGVADEDFNISENDEEQEHNGSVRNLNKKDKKKVNGKGRIPDRDVVKEATLGNISILNALEDCDVSLNFVKNLDNTILDKQDSKMKSKQDECKETTTEENKCQDNDGDTDEGMNMDEEDLDMDCTILRRIQMDLDMENDDDDMAKTSEENVSKSMSVKDLKEDNEKKDDCNSSTEDDQNVTLTDHNISKSVNASSNTRVAVLRNLLSDLDGLDDVDDLLDNIEDSMISKHEDELKQGKDQKTLEINRLTEETDIDLDEFNLNSSILKQCLADDDDDEDGRNEKQTAENCNQNLSKSDKEDVTEVGQMSALQLQVMADWDLDVNDLENCLNNSSFVPEDAAKTNETAKGDKTHVTPTSSKKYSGTVEKLETSTTKDMTLTKDMTTKECKNVGRASDGQLNITRSPQFVKTTPKSSTNLKNNKKTPKCQKTPEVQNRSFSKQETIHVDETHRAEEDSGEFKAAANTPKSVKNTPKSTKTVKKCRNITPKIRKSVPTNNTCKESKTFFENIEKELPDNNSHLTEICGKDNKMSPNARKSENIITNAEIRIAEDGKELETNKFEEGLSEDKSSTLIDEENTESPEKSKGVSLHTLLSNGLDEEDLDTLINQIEINAHESIKDTNEITTMKESNEGKQDNEEVSMEDEMAIFRKFIGLDSSKTKEEEEQFEADEKEEEQFKANEEEEQFEVDEEEEQFKTNVEEKEQFKTNEEEEEEQFKANEEAEEQCKADEEEEQFKANECEQERFKSNEKKDEQFKANEGEEEQFKANELEEEQFKVNEEEEEQFKDNEEQDEQFKANEEEDEQFKAIEGEEEQLNAIDVVEEQFKTNEEDAEQFQANVEEDVDDFENLLNEDLSKALEKALGEDNDDLLKLNEDECNLKASEEKKMPTTLQCEKEKSHHEKKPLSKMTSKSCGRSHFEAKYSKTNQRAKYVQGKSFKVLDNAQKKPNHNVLPPKLTNKIQLNNQQQRKTVSRTMKDNKSLLQQKLYKTNSKPEQSPKQFNENQENSSINTNFPSTSKTQLESKQQQHQARLIKIKNENFTPSRCFINMQRGERTPMKLNDLFSKQTPKTEEKSAEKPGNTLTQLTPDNKMHRKSPSECRKNLTKTISPNTSKTPTTTKMSPQNRAVIKHTGRISPQVIDAKSTDTLRTNVQTPKRIRNVSVRLQRYPSYTEASKSTESLTSPQDIKSPTKQQTPLNKTSPLSALERENLSSVFKLPNGITISKVTPTTSPRMVEITPSKSNYCKQNFTEQQLIAGLQNTIHTESLINSLPSSVTVTKTGASLASRLRARQPSIDIVPSGKSPKKCLDYKSYAVNRSARKKAVLNRMRTIKKQIFKSIESNSLVNSKFVKSPLPKKRKRSVIQIENVQILPYVTNEVLTPLLNGQNLSPQMQTSQDVLAQTTPKSIMDYNSLNSIGSSVKPVEEASSARTTKHNKEGKSRETTPKHKEGKSRETTPKHKEGKSRETTPKHKEGKSRETTPKHKAGKKSPEATSIHIKEDKSSESTQGGQKYRKSCETTSDSTMKDKSPESSSKQTIKDKDILSTPPKKSMKAAKTPTTGRRGRSEKRRATTPIEEEEQVSPKRLHLSPIKQDELESDADFLQRGLKSKRINVDSIINDPMPVDDITLDITPEKKSSAKLKDSKMDVSKPSGEDCNTSDTNILDDLLEQVTTEDTLDANKIKEKKIESPPKYNTVQDYNDSKDLELLEIVGLKIVNVADVEDCYNAEEVDIMRLKAKTFADVCKQYLRVFSYSKLVEPVMLLKNMRTAVNNVFKKNFSINDIKRVVNLVVLWYTNCCNNKLIEKKPVLESTNYYLLAFNFIPKTARRIYYCEFCDDNFNTEHKYYSHRIKHTGAHYPYSCKNCPVGFLRPQTLKTHHSICANRQKQKQTKPVADKAQQNETNATSNDDNKVSVTMLENENAVKSEHINSENEVKKLIKSENESSRPVQRRLHTVYRCVKCEMSFTSEPDIKLHMNSCNRNLRRQPKNCTPRPKPKVEPYSKN